MPGVLIPLKKFTALTAMLKTYRVEFNRRGLTRDKEEYFMI